MPWEMFVVCKSKLEGAPMHEFRIALLKDIWCQLPVHCKLSGQSIAPEGGGAHSCPRRCTLENIVRSIFNDAVDMVVQAV